MESFSICSFVPCFFHSAICCFMLLCYVTRLCYTVRLFSLIATIFHCVNIATQIFKVNINTVCRFGFFFDHQSLLSREPENIFVCNLCPDTLISDSGLQNQKRIIFIILNHQVCDNLYNSHRKIILGLAHIGQWGLGNWLQK